MEEILAGRHSDSREGDMYLCRISEDEPATATSRFLSWVRLGGGPPRSPERTQGLWFRPQLRSCALTEPAFPGRLLWAWRRRQHGGAPDGDASGQTKVSWAEGGELGRRGDGAGRAWAWRVCKQEGKGS